LLFASHGLEFVTLKGPLLSHLLYDSFSLRLSTDIDLLVSYPDFPRADHLLRQSGYSCFEPSSVLSPSQTRLYAQYRHHYAYRQSDKGISIELHWSLAEPYYLSRQTSQLWMSRARQIRVPGLTVDVLSNEDLLVYVLLHGAKHRWSSARHLLDLLAVLRLPYNFDWQLIEESLRLTRLERVAAQGLALLQALWGFSAPAPLQSFARPDAASRFLSRFSLELLSWPEVEKRKDPRWFMYGLLLKPGLVYQTHYLSKTLAVPLIERVKK
jgi:hypothetical protein